MYERKRKGETEWLPIIGASLPMQTNSKDREALEKGKEITLDFPYIGTKYRKRRANP